MQTSPFIAIDEYLAGERAGDARHEYVDGQIFAMTGASRNHRRIVKSLGFALDALARPKNCEVFLNNLKCEEGENEYTQTPCLVIEVLPPTTEDTDRGEKFFYRKLPVYFRVRFACWRHYEPPRKNLQNQKIVCEKPDPVHATRLPRIGAYRRTGKSTPSSTNRRSTSLSAPLGIEANRPRSRRLYISHQPCRSVAES